MGIKARKEKSMENPIDYLGQQLSSCLLPTPSTYVMARKAYKNFCSENFKTHIIIKDYSPRSNEKGKGTKISSLIGFGKERKEEAKWKQTFAFSICLQISIVPPLIRDTMQIENSQEDEKTLISVECAERTCVKLSKAFLNRN